MPWKRFKREEMVTHLSHVELLESQRMSVADAIRPARSVQIGVSEVTYFTWRKEYGGVKADQLKRPKELEEENQRLRKAVSDLTLDRLILKRRLQRATAGA